MNEVYEYRRAPNLWVMRLSVVSLALLIMVIALTGAHHLTALAWGLGAATLYWMLLPHPVSGIRVDDNYLVLAAWRRPRAIPLDNIAYLRITEVSAECTVTIVYKDGREEGTFAGDLPSIEALSDVMAERGIPLRESYLGL
ncbi:hypothetical protein [Yoonia sediminilitoris]|uniref:PH (Pleckstrin Homology) domain-containing protein n=1 Tax=Yoonia sediminilitoris TaxID=1286148 RepID=A0A2T6K7S6_9RHOB|nr:hypothetical protein [Yoonia sediminilitoris]PUB10723.1 hypothetical protein C8N45_11768 [Yoonia sediminilitoris]RCW90475.1 hypothetical protein DFP92_11768 [Yoonia sediminilitoris]